MIEISNIDATAPTLATEIDGTRFAMRSIASYMRKKKVLSRK